jgi:hypothetical protein
MNLRDMFTGNIPLGSQADPQYNKFTFNLNGVNMPLDEAGLGMMPLVPGQKMGATGAPSPSMVPSAGGKNRVPSTAPGLLPSLYPELPQLRGDYSNYSQPGHSGGFLADLGGSKFSFLNNSAYGGSAPGGQPMGLRKRMTNMMYG